MFRIARRFEGRWAFVLSAVLLRVALEWGYLAFVARLFAYAGFVVDFSWFKYLESWAIYLLLAVSFPSQLSKASDYLLTLLLGGLLAPLLVLYPYANKARVALYCVLFGVVLIVLFRRGRPLNLVVVRNGQQLGIAIMWGLAAGVSAWYLLSGGLAYFNLDLAAVYEYRRAVAEVTGGPVVTYLNNWAPKVAGPTLLAYFLWKRLYILAAGVFGLHLFWFGISAHKSVLFYPFLITFAWFWFRRTNALSIVLFGMAGAVVVAIVVSLVTDRTLVASLFVRRVFFVIAANVFDYYEFFSNNPHVYWSNSLTSAFIDYPYHVNPALLIGEWRGTEAHVNNSFLSTGYMHAGVWGIVIYGAIAGLLFRLLDSMVRNGTPVWVGVAAVLVPGRSLILSADLPTALLTHGVGLSFLILFLLRSPNDHPVQGRSAPQR